MATNAVTRLNGVVAPASPFAELLRRSRFASYDPKINQAYSAPPAYTHRGNWGLKRPISQRRKGSYITLKSYEEHAQYIEWNNAEGQVRLVKQIEELNITPKVSPTSTWFRNLGPQGTILWVTDSEFAPAHTSMYDRGVSPPSSEQPATEELVLGKAGPGAYGSSSDTATAIRTNLLRANTNKVWDYRQPIPAAMNARQFEHYLKKLRKLRPAFYKELRENINRVQQEGKATMLDNAMTNLEIGVVNTAADDHYQFLNNFFDKQWAKEDRSPSAPDPVTGESLPKDFVRLKIKPQPHRFGGLIYSHPSPLETYYTTSPKPAHVVSDKPIEDAKTGQFTASKRDIARVSFAGILGASDKSLPFDKPLFGPNRVPKPDAIEESVITVRPLELELKYPPRVVGQHPQGIEGVGIGETVFECAPHENRTEFDNTKPPGSFEYASHNPHNSLSTYSKSLFSRSSGARQRPGANFKLMSKLNDLVASQTSS